MAAGRETLSVFLERWLDAREGTIRPSTHALYTTLVRTHLKPTMGHHKLSTLKPEQLVELYTVKRKAGLSPRTVRLLHTTLRLALATAARWGAVPRNVAAVVDPPKVPRKEIAPPSPADLTRLLDVAEQVSDRLSPLWTVAAYSGFRRGELLGLKWEDVDLQSETISAKRTLIGARDRQPIFSEPKTTRSRRTITLFQDAVAALQRGRGRQAEERLAVGMAYADFGLVFASEIGTPIIPRNATRAFKAALARAGLPRTVRLHDLRHYAATLMRAAGVHPKVASERLGHSTVSLTLDLYIHAVKGLDADAAERMQVVMRAARVEVPDRQVAAV